METNSSSTHTRCGLHCGAGSKSSNQNGQVGAEREQQRAEGPAVEARSVIVLLYHFDLAAKFIRRISAAEILGDHEKRGQSRSRHAEVRDPPGPAANKENRS